jgi:hypothetical protein
LEERAKKLSFRWRELASGHPTGDEGFLVLFFKKHDT